MFGLFGDGAVFVWLFGMIWRIFEDLVPFFWFLGVFLISTKVFDCVFRGCLEGFQMVIRDFWHQVVEFLWGGGGVFAEVYR